MFKQMTNKQRFIRALVKGWKEWKLPYAKHIRYDRETGGMCAIGVAQFVSGQEKNVINTYGGFRRIQNDFNFGTSRIPWDIAKISNAAGNKTKAIRDLKAQLPEW